MSATESKPEVKKKLWQTPVLKELAVGETKQACVSGSFDVYIR